MAQKMNADFAKWMQGKAIVKKTDMQNQMLVDTQDLVTSAIEKYSGAEGLNMESAAKFVKQGMDKSYGAYWHCMIGQGFGFDVTSQAKATLFMYYAGNLAILVFKG